MMMVKMGQTPRRVRYLAPAPHVGDIEVNTLAGIRERGGRHEFLTSQVLDFDLLFYLESGTAVHTVDFADHTLSTGDLLWVRAGQLHQWGRIDDIEGPVVMFGPHAVDDRTSNLIRSQLVRTRNHWTATDLDTTPVLRAIDLLTTSIDQGRTEAKQPAPRWSHALALCAPRLSRARRTGRRRRCTGADP